MARLVVLYFEDNEAAEAAMVETLGASPVGLYGIPTQFCTCPPYEQNRRTNAFGAKYGWLVHRECGKAKGHSQIGLKNLYKGPLPVQLNSFHPTLSTSRVYYASGEAPE